MDGVDEIELKLEAEPGGFDHDTLFPAPPARVEHLLSTYWDTPERALAHAGYTLRIRRDGDGRRIQTVKATGAAAVGLFVRPEWECPVDHDAPRLDAAAGPLGGVLDADVLARLEPAFTIAVDRRTHIVAGTGGTIEVAVDDGTVRHGDATARFAEIELELRDGTPDALFALARDLAARAPLRLGVVTKAERAAPPATAYRATPPAFGPDDDARDGFAAIAAAAIRQYRLNETLLRAGGGPEALHQARVAIRRLRSAFTLFAPLFADDPHVKPLRRGLKALALDLGAVRDLDVLLARFDGPDRDRIVAARAAAADDLAATLASSPVRDLTIDLAQWLTTGAWRTAPADPDRAARPIALAAADILDRRRRRLKKRGRGLVRRDDAARHTVRIETKTLRYAAEFFAALYPGRKAARRHDRFLAALEALQDRLGTLNDRATAATLLAGLGIAAPPARDGPKAKTLLAQAEEAFDAFVDAKRFWR